MKKLLCVQMGSREAKGVLFAALLLVSTGLLYANRQRAVGEPVNRTAPPSFAEHSTEAKAILEDLRQRFATKPATKGSQGTPNTDMSPLIAGLAERLDVASLNLVPQFSNRPAAPSATVLLPQSAAGTTQVQDSTSGMRVQARLLGATDAPAEFVDGYAVYQHAHASGATVLRRAMPDGVEDFLSFAEAPAEPSVIYELKLGGEVAGLRLVANTLEFLDSDGAPRLRVAPPYLIDADGSWIEAKLEIGGCDFDSDAAPPWHRNTIGPGAESCKMRVGWGDSGVIYPALLDPTWITTGSMISPRQGHSVSLLPTGRVLVAGGSDNNTALATAELYDRASGTWAATGSMSTPRRQHAAVLLPSSSNATTSERVLVSGGLNSTATLSTAQLYSAATGTWVAAANMNAARHSHTATLLPNGRVLVTGGQSGSATLGSAAVYNPTNGAGAWSATIGPMPSALRAHSATLLTTSNAQLNGKVLVSGGNSGTATVAAVYLYDPAQLQFSTLAAMPVAREGHTATLLANGRVLIAGGKNGTTSSNSATLFDASSGPGSWSWTGSMGAPRHEHTASRLANGQVLVVGGSNGATSLSTAELFNGSTGWTATTSLPSPVQGHAAVVLPDGVVLIAGGLNGATVLDAARLYDVNGGNSCTDGSQCASSNCVGGICCNSACTDQCFSCALPGSVGICSPRPNGSVCSDGSLCTQADACQGGACIGSSPVTCVVLDQCHDVGACDPSTGECANPSKPDGSTCNDGNACTQTDQCASGTCAGENPVTCTALDACHVAGTCEPSTGTCSNPQAPNGTNCSDGNACTAGDSCQIGICQAGAAIPVDDGNPCTTDHCDPIGGVVHVLAPPGTICTEGNICTGAGTCSASGICIPGTVPTVDDGNPCTIDSCDPFTGVAHTPVAAGTSCSDGNACNGIESCNALGACIAGTPRQWTMGILVRSIAAIPLPGWHIFQCRRASLARTAIYATGPNPATQRGVA